MDDLAPAPDALLESGETNEPRVPHRLYALKDKDTFLVADAFGDIVGAGDGLFHNDTRILSTFRLLIGNAPPSLLSAATSQDNVFFTSHGSNQVLPIPGGSVGPPGILHIERKRLLCGERFYERIRIVNYSRDEVIVPLRIDLGADFRDMFEVRGMKRRRRGLMLPATTDGRSVTYRYEGLDRVERGCTIAFSDPPGRLTAHRAEFMYAIMAEGQLEVFIEVGPTPDATPSKERFRAAAAKARWDMRSRGRHGARIATSGRLFNDWLGKSRADLALLTTLMSSGPYPYAGIPWFSTTFGRDAIITAWQILWFEPSLAKGVLRFLADNQAQEVSAFRDSAPGKIMHEARRGEMPALGEVPFGRYYGGVDSTPLFVALAGAYAERTGDMDLIEQLWPALEKAVGWIQTYGDSNGDGFLDYARGAESGLSNQGWKDSGDSVFHADGRFPKGPIALVEVQGYVFAAYKAMAALSGRRGDEETAARWTDSAERIRQGVEARFWMEDKGFYGIALDGEGDLCQAVTSNPGHLLFCGLPTPARGRRVTEKLLSSAFASGWGLRTLAVNEARYNPMSYHNGSVWPHDTALGALGMARYGERDGVVRMMSSVFEAATQFEMRLPELFCGFARNAGEPPIPYPSACVPQAWAAGSVFMMLQACLGVTVDAFVGKIHIEQPRLPVGISQLFLQGLRAGPGLCDLVFERAHDSEEVKVRVTRCEGLDVQIA